MTDAGKQAAVVEVDGVRYLNGHLDLNHAPSLATYIGKSLASHVSGNRMPCMSGDDRERIPEHIRRRYDGTCESVAAGILKWQAASGEAGLAGYAGVKDAEVNNSLPTQGGGAGDRETVARIIAPEKWEEIDGYDAVAKHPLTTTDDAIMHAINLRDDLIWDEEQEGGSLTKADAILSALQAAPAAGDRETVLASMIDLGKLAEYEGRGADDLGLGEVERLLQIARSQARRGDFYKEEVSRRDALQAAPSEGVSSPYGEFTPITVRSYSMPVPSEGGEPVAWREALEPFDVVGIPAWGDDEKVHLTCDGQSLGSIRLGAFRRLAEEPLVGWRPIETAPKDGTAILAWCVHPHARYAGDDNEWSAPVIAKWIDHNGGGWTWNGMVGTFTHWMPLPAAPAPDAIRGGE